MTTNDVSGTITLEGSREGQLSGDGWIVGDEEGAIVEEMSKTVVVD